MKAASDYGLTQCPACGSWVRELIRHNVWVSPLLLWGEPQPGTGDQYDTVGCNTAGCPRIEQRPGAA